MESEPLPPMREGNPSGYGRASWQRATPLLLAAAVALYFLWRVRDVLTPFFIAFFLAALLDPIVTKLQSKGMSRGRAVANIYLSVFLGILIVAAVIIPAAFNQLNDISRNFPDYQKAFVRTENDLFDQYGGKLAWAGIHKEHLLDKTGPVGQFTQTALQTLQATALGLAGQVLWVIIIPLSLFFFLMDYHPLRAKLISMVPERYRSNLDTMSLEVVDIFSTYVRSLAIVCACYGAGATVLFFLLGLKYALFLGIAAGVLYAVPYVGPLIAIGGAAITALLVNSSILGMTVSPMAHAILVAVLFLVMHFTFDYGVTPRVVGGSVGLHPLVNVFALMCGATLFGVWGMLLAVPVAASIQMILIYFFPKLAEKPPVTPARPSAQAPEEWQVR